MLSAAFWLLAELQAPLQQLTAAGYELVLTGHSLGAGVAALLSLLLSSRLRQPVVHPLTTPYSLLQPVISPHPPSHTHTPSHTLTHPLHTLTHTVAGALLRLRHPLLRVRRGAPVAAAGERRGLARATR